MDPTATETTKDDRESFTSEALSPSPKKSEFRQETTVLEDTLPIPNVAGGVVLEVREVETGTREGAYSSGSKVQGVETTTTVPAAGPLNGPTKTERFSRKVLFSILIGVLVLATITYFLFSWPRNQPSELASVHGFTQTTSLPERLFTIVIEPTQFDTVAHVIRLNVSKPLSAEDIALESYKAFELGTRIFSDGSPESVKDFLGNLVGQVRGFIPDEFHPSSYIYLRMSPSLIESDPHRVELIRQNAEAVFSETNFSKPDNSIEMLDEREHGYFWWLSTMFRAHKPFQKSTTAVIVFDHDSVKVTYQAKKKKVRTQILKLPGDGEVSFYSYAYRFGIDTAREEMFRSVFRTKGNEVENSCIHTETTDFTWYYRGYEYTMSKDMSEKSPDICERDTAKYFVARKVYPEIELLDFDVVVISVYHHLLRGLDLTRFPHDYEEEFSLNGLKDNIAHQVCLARPKENSQRFLCEDYFFIVLFLKGLGLSSKEKMRFGTMMAGEKTSWTLGFALTLL